MLIVTFAVAIVSGAAIGALGLAIVTAYKHKDQVRRLRNAAEFERAMESVRQQMCRQTGLPDTSGWSDISCRLSRLQAIVLSRGLSEAETAELRAHIATHMSGGENPLEAA
jgi:hypothetical protein